MARTTLFSALRWERDVAEKFLEWRTTSAVGPELMRTFGDAVERLLRQDGRDVANSGLLAASLPTALQSCDQLSFDDRAEALAYGALHLLDRYGRVDQVLQYLIRIGRLPLRIGGACVLEVGSGPAPALYATRDFYSALVRWPGRGETSLGALAAFDTLDRGPAWDSFLHHLSESLMCIRGDALDRGGQLAFARTVHDLAQFDVHERHHRSVARSAARVVDEFDRVDEWISDAAARRRAYEQGVREPSAYDIVFLCYFLTQRTMTEQFALELRRLALALTPGGVLVVIGGTGEKYRELYAQVRTTAATAKLRDMSPQDAFRANAESHRLQLVAGHVRANVDFALTKAPATVRFKVAEALPRDLVNPNVPFRLPRFHALVFVRQGPRRRSRAQRTAATKA